MSQWVDRIENHSIHGSLQSLEATLQRTADVAAREHDSLVTHHRLSQIAALVRSYLASLDPALVPPNVLNALHSYVQQMVSYVEQYSSSEQAHHLIAASDPADNALVQLAALPIPFLSADLEGVRETILTFRRSASQHLRYLEEEQARVQASLDTLRSRIEEASVEVTNQKTRLDTAISLHQQQFSQAEDTRRQEFNSAERARANEFQSSEEDRSDRFGELHREHNDRLSALATEIAKNWDSFIQDSKAGGDSLETEIRLGAEAVLKELGAHKLRAEQLVHVIANTGMVGGYQRIANEERSSARFWQGVAGISMVGLIGFAVYAFWATIAGSVEWAAFAVRVFVAVAFGVLAAYGARQADKHEERERHSRQMELELASINPFISELPEATQHQLKQDLALKMFGRDGAGSAKVAQTTGTSADLLRLALESIANFSQKS